MSKKIKVKFLRDYAPRKKGTVVELEDKLASFYLNNGIAEVVNSKSTKESTGCEDCQKASQAVSDLATANDKVTALEGELSESKTALEVAKTDLATAKEEAAKDKAALVKANKEIAKLKK